jgi:hypothetical protein
MHGTLQPWRRAGGQTAISGENIRAGAGFPPVAPPVRQEVTTSSRQLPYTDSSYLPFPRIPRSEIARSRPALQLAALSVHPGVLDMTPVEEQQMLTSLTAISQDIKALLTLVRDLTLQQDAADQKAYSQLVNIAHKR